MTTTWWTECVDPECIAADHVGEDSDWPDGVEHAWDDEVGWMVPAKMEEPVDV